MFKTTLILALTIFTSQTILAADEWQMEGKVIYVEDGDTLTLMLDDFSRYSIRLTDIDAPETSHGRNKPGQPYSQVSKHSLTSLANGKRATAYCFGYDVHRTRPVCRVSVGNLDVGAEQLKRGMVWVYQANRKYVRDQQSYSIEAQAKAAGIGLWAAPAPQRIPPWEWRRQCWKQQLCEGAGE